MKVTDVKKIFTTFSILFFVVFFSAPLQVVNYLRDLTNCLTTSNLQVYSQFRKWTFDSVFAQALLSGSYCCFPLWFLSCTGNTFLLNFPFVSGKLQSHWQLQITTYTQAWVNSSTTNVRQFGRLQCLQRLPHYFDGDLLLCFFIF